MRFFILIMTSMSGLGSFALDHLSQNKLRGALLETGGFGHLPYFLKQLSILNVPIIGGSSEECVSFHKMERDLCDASFLPANVKDELQKGMKCGVHLILRDGAPNIEQLGLSILQNTNSVALNYTETRTNEYGFSKQSHKYLISLNPDCNLDVAVIDQTIQTGGIQNGSDIHYFFKFNEKNAKIQSNVDEIEVEPALLLPLLEDLNTDSGPSKELVAAEARNDIFDRVIQSTEMAGEFQTDSSELDTGAEYVGNGVHATALCNDLGMVELVTRPMEAGVAIESRAGHQDTFLNNEAESIASNIKNSMPHLNQIE